MFLFLGAYPLSILFSDIQPICFREKLKQEGGAHLGLQLRLDLLNHRIRASGNKEVVYDLLGDILHELLASPLLRERDAIPASRPLRHGLPKLGQLLRFILLPVVLLQDILDLGKAVGHEIHPSNTIYRPDRGKALGMISNFLEAKDKS
jgi:hypothetical protein